MLSKKIKYKVRSFTLYAIVCSSVFSMYCMDAMCNPEYIISIDRKNTSVPQINSVINLSILQISKELPQKDDEVIDGVFYKKFSTDIQPCSMKDIQTFSNDRGVACLIKKIDGIDKMSTYAVKDVFELFISNDGSVVVNFFDKSKSIKVKSTSQVVIDKITANSVDIEAQSVHLSNRNDVINLDSLNITSANKSIPSFLSIGDSTKLSVKNLTISDYILSNYGAITVSEQMNLKGVSEIQNNGDIRTSEIVSYADKGLIKGVSGNINVDRITSKKQLKIDAIFQNLKNVSIEKGAALEIHGHQGLKFENLENSGNVSFSGTMKIEGYFASPDASLDLAGEMTFMDIKNDGIINSSCGINFFQNGNLTKIGKLAVKTRIKHKISVEIDLGKSGILPQIDGEEKLYNVESDKKISIGESLDAEVDMRLKAPAFYVLSDLRLRALIAEVSERFYNAGNISSETIGIISKIIENKGNIKSSGTLNLRGSVLNDGCLFGNIIDISGDKFVSNKVVRAMNTTLRSNNNVLSGILGGEEIYIGGLVENSANIKFKKGTIFGKFINSSIVEIENELLLAGAKVEIQNNDKISADVMINNSPETRIVDTKDSAITGVKAIIVKEGKINLLANLTNLEKVSIFDKAELVIEKRSKTLKLGKVSSKGFAQFFSNMPALSTVENDEGTTVEINTDKLDSLQYIDGVKGKLRIPFNCNVPKLGMGYLSDRRIDLF